jgi:hypothetical protein
VAESAGERTVLFIEQVRRRFGGLYMLQQGTDSQRYLFFVEFHFGVVRSTLQRLILQEECID